MNRSISRILMVLVASALVPHLGASQTPPRCKGEPNACEKQIRNMLAKKRYLGVALENTDWGTVVKRVDENSPADRGGLAAGDRIIGVDGHDTERKSPHEIKALLMPYDRGDRQVAIVVVRLGEPLRLYIRMAPMPDEQIDKIVESHLDRRHRPDED